MNPYYDWQVEFGVDWSTCVLGLALGWDRGKFLAAVGPFYVEVTWS